MRKTIGCCLLCAGVFFPLGATTSNYYVYTDVDVKAAYIFNLVGFVSFPGKKLEEATICIQGDDLVGLALAKKEAAESAGITLLVTKKSKNDPLKNCHILYISSNMVDYVNSSLYKTKELPILTVSDIPDFARYGGMVEFISENRKIRLIINQTRSSSVGITISSGLLQIAKKVL